MAIVLADRVKETTNTTGTGTLTLAGAVSGFQSFAAIGNTNQTYYCIVSGTNWEVGQGTYTLAGTTLSRDTVFASSNAGSLITVAAGAEVFATYPANTAITDSHIHTDKAFSGTQTDGIVIDYVDPFARISVAVGDGIRFFTGGVAGTQIAEFKSNGDTDFSGVLSCGTGSLITGATNPQIAAAGGSATYIQLYIHNDSAGSGSSADLIAYPDNGTDTSGWADLGCASSVFSDAAYSVTGPNEAYLFASAPSGAGKTGNMVYATDSTGSLNAHQWYVGGFNQAKTAWKMQLSSSGLDFKTPILLNSSAGTSGYVLASAGAGATPTWKPLYKTITFGGTGTPSTGNTVTPLIMITEACTVISACVNTKTAPGTGGFIYSIVKSTDGGATFPTTLATQTLTSGSKTLGPTAQTANTLASGDLLGINISAVNSAADWTVELVVRV